MAEPPEFWTFVASNVFVFVLGSGLTVLSLAAYRRRGRPALGFAVAGFAVVTVGTLVEAVYEIAIRGSYELTGRELLALHTVESVLVGIGLAALFYSIVRY